MGDKPLVKLAFPTRAWIALAIAWLGVSAVVAWAVGVPYGLFLAWAGIATAVFILHPFAGTLGLLILNIVAADWGQAFVLFPGKPYNINQAGLANLVMTGLALLYVIRRRPRPAPLTLPFLAFLAAGIVSVPFSSSPFAGLRDWTRMIPLAGLYIVAADLFREAPERARVWIVGVVASSVWPAVVAVYQTLTDTGLHTFRDEFTTNRLLGTFGHPITYGMYLGIIVLMSLLRLRESDHCRARVALALWGGVSLALLFLTYSRGPSFVMVAALVVLGLLARRESWRTRAAVCLVAAAFLAASLLWGYTGDLGGVESLLEEIEPLPQTTQRTQVPVPAAQGATSFAWRLNLWRFAVMLAKERPLVGLGLGGFPQQSPRIVGFAVTPHNDFVRVLAEMGLLGLGAFIWLWAALARRLVRFWQEAADRTQSLLAAVLLAVAVGYGINCLAADMLNNPTAGWVFWPLMALPEAFAHRAGTRG